MPGLVGVWVGDAVMTSTTERQRLTRLCSPCPWHCERQDLEIRHGEVACYQVTCMECGARGPSRETDGEAVRAWNGAARG